MKTRIALTFVLLAAATAFSQNCSQSIIDNAHVLNQSDPKLNQAISQLNAAGADTHVVTIPSLGFQPNLDVAEGAIESQCPEWLGANHLRKSTLVVLALDPKDHKSGIYYGSAWHKALDDHFTRIYTDYMMPRYKSGQWSDGLTAGVEQISKRITASKDEALHPAVSTTVNQAADYTGLWSDFGWLLFLLGLAAAGILALVYIVRSRRERDETAYAQQLALTSRNRVTSALAQLKGAILAATETGSAKLGQAVYDIVSEQYGDFTSSKLGDPEQKGLPVATYKSMAETFEGMAFKLNREIDRMNGVDDKSRDDGHNSFYPTATRKHHSHDSGQSMVTPPAPTAPGNTTPPQTSPSGILGGNTVVVVNNEDNYREDNYRSNAYPSWGSVDSSSDVSSGSSSSGSSSSSDDDSGGGGSSSSDDDSSDSGGGGSSSSDDSGSSDSGGGGSDDF